MIMNNRFDATTYRPRKTKYAAALYAFFLGIFGIHKFYLGYYQTGFIMLGISVIGGIATFGIASCVMWLIAIVEGIVYCLRKPDAFQQTYVLHERSWF